MSEPVGRALIGREFGPHVGATVKCLYCRAPIVPGKERHVEPNGLAHTVCWLRQLEQMRRFRSMGWRR